jgi:hypothetical protein
MSRMEVIGCENVRKMKEDIRDSPANVFFYYVK